MTTSLDLVNRALTEIAGRQPLAVLNTSTAAGRAALQLYDPAVEMLLRQQDWEFSRASVALSTQAGTPPLQWDFQYTYPTDCLRVRQVVPATWDDFDPHQVVWDVGTVSSVRVIWTNEDSASLIYTTNAITPNEMDAVFQEQLVRYLGSMFAMPIGGRPDFSREMLQQAGGLSQAGRDRDA